MRDPELGCDPYDLASAGDRRRLLRRLVGARTAFDAVVALHSVFSNEQHLRGALLRVVARLRAPKVLFLGNEYKLMPEKMRFADALGVSLLVTQLDAPEAQDLYRRRLGCRVVCIPYTGLDVDVFHPGAPLDRRPIDLGYRAYAAPLYLGHDERSLLAAHFRERAYTYRLTVDLSLDARDRLEEGAWADFLRSCRGQLGSEAGGDYFELDDATRRKVNAFVDANPDVTTDAVLERFFSAYRDPVSGRALSGRVIEAAGTKTVQLLVEGRYGGYFEPDLHYIPLRNDLSNAAEAVGKLRENALCESLVAAAHRVVTEKLTYASLIERLRIALTPLL